MDTVQKAGIAIIIFGLITICLGFRKCNPDNGPSGVYDCVPLKGYDLPQYATCLTNAYAEMKTNYRYACGKNLYGIRPTYCWYQCMVELHDMDNGQVKNDCACNLGQHVTKYPGYISTTHSPIPGRCHTPTGYDCLWFSTCLNSKYSCHGRDYKVVIELGSNICNFASKTKEKISENGSLWYESAQKCFQVQMAPVLKQWLHLNCSTVENKATSVRNQCLTEPLGVISLCDLSNDVQWTIFWSIRESFDKNLVPSIAHFMHLIQNCSTPEKKSNITEMRLFFSPTSNIHVTNKMIEDYFSKIVTKMNWQDEGIRWFCVLSQQIIVYLAVPPKTDKNQGKQNGTRLDEALMKFANAFEDGEFQGNLIQLDKMFVCKDIHCEDTYLHRNASYPEQTKPRKHEEKKNSHFGIMGIGIGVFLGIFVVAVCVMCLARWVRLNRPRDIRHFILTED
ncbi:uncharacterized protein LOC143076606 [Mytilus galloprovincialis]|uniref:uncharacterized protein LOC143076606 n=1 Tax=Mytilus galloprovincialis TaxID=29158 RepID=UPI003F7BDDD4